MPGKASISTTPHEAIIGESLHTQYPRFPLCCTLGCDLSLVFSLGADDDALFSGDSGSCWCQVLYNQMTSKFVIMSVLSRDCPYCPTIHVTHASSE